MASDSLSLRNRGVIPCGFEWHQRPHLPMAVKQFGSSGVMVLRLAESYKERQADKIKYQKQ